MRRKFRNSNLFSKKISKLKGENLTNIIKKIDEILESSDINSYKNLRHSLKKYKRVHINGSYVILFFGDDNIVYFVDYEHHDKVYNFDKKQLQKYDKLAFS